MKNTMRSLLMFSTVFVVAVVLSSCGPSKKEVAKESAVLVEINGKPVITAESFYQEVGSMVGRMDPKLLPAATQKKVLADMTRFEAAFEAAKRDKLDKDPRFIKIYKEQKDRLKKVALVRFADKEAFDKMPIDEVATKEHFEKNKARFVKEQGGVLVSGVSFSDRNKALAFYERAKGIEKAEDFASLAKKEKDGKFREFGRVGQEEQGYSMVTPAVKSAALKLTKLPGVDVVKDGKETLIIHVSDKKDAVYYEYAEIAERLGNQLKVSKFMEKRNSDFEQQKKDLNIKVNEDFFKEESAAPGEPAKEEGAVEESGKIEESEEAKEVPEAGKEETDKEVA